MTLKQGLENEPKEMIADAEGFMDFVLPPDNLCKWRARAPKGSQLSEREVENPATLLASGSVEAP